jgi:hypothetical protein
MFRIGVWEWVIIAPFCSLPILAILVAAWLIKRKR